MRDSSPRSPQCDTVDEKESHAPAGADKRFWDNSFLAGAGKSNSVDCL